MAYQYKREPLSPEEANRLVNACDTHQERLVVWTLLDTGLRVSELAFLTRKAIDWQSSPQDRHTRQRRPLRDPI